jgi:hypothetical protein
MAQALQKRLHAGCVLAMAVLTWDLFAPMLGAQSPPRSEYDVKAAFLMNFTRFVEWPSAVFAEAGSPFAICILGRDPFGRALDDIVQGESVKGHTLVVRRIAQAPAPQACHIVFVEEPAKENAKILHELGPGVLTVGEGEDFLREGGMITFVVLNRRVRFDVHQSVAEATGLKLSSQLLSVARVVEK